MGASDDLVGQRPVAPRAVAEPPAPSAGAMRLAGALRQGARARSTSPYFEAMAELREAAVDYVLELKALGVPADRAFLALRDLARSTLGARDGETGARAARAARDVREGLGAQVMRWAMASYYQAD